MNEPQASLLKLDHNAQCGNCAFLSEIGIFAENNLAGS